MNYKYIIIYGGESDFALACTFDEAETAIKDLIDSTIVITVEEKIRKGEQLWDTLLPMNVFAAGHALMNVLWKR